MKEILLNIIKRSILAALLLILVACGGSDGNDAIYSSDGANGSGANTSGGKTDQNSIPTGATPTADSEQTFEQTSNPLEAYFSSSLQPSLDMCRLCHVPNGVADIGTSDPKRQNRFILSADANDDYLNLIYSWNEMGGGVESNPLLLAPSMTGQHHTGGKIWPQGSQNYVSMQNLLTCWQDMDLCEVVDEGLVFNEEDTSPSTDLPLLGSRRASSTFNDYCQDKGDEAELPLDPRSLIRPGINEGKAVAFNAYWQDCTSHYDYELIRPKTCGEYRARISEGSVLMHKDLSMKFGYWFSTSRHYHNIWRRWGLSERPENFDELVRIRYGLPVAPNRNPYPLPGEDPLITDGGSGQLPLGLVQIKDKQGRYNGNVSFSCDICHVSSIDALEENGSPAYLSGMGANTVDMQLLITDLFIPLPIGLNQSRGVTNAMGLSGLLISVLDPDSLGLFVGNAAPMQFPGNTRGGGDTKMPPLWNASHRPRKFWDAGLSYDATRLDSAILNVSAAVLRPLGTDKSFNRNLRNKVEEDSVKIQAYIDSLTSPEYPFDINVSLAEQGAVLFHAKDLWANGENRDIQKPPTNGSCAGCHGVYSPRYIYDSDYLEDPRLEGVAGYIAPLDQIRTDPERMKSFTKPLLELISTSWFSYPEGNESFVPPDEKTFTQELVDNWAIFQSGKRPKGACTWQGVIAEDVRGYLAPPLYGVWATAPYLHNGSVPSIWTLLTPEERPVIWRRTLTERIGAESGFDTSAEAYDQDHMGWKYNDLICEDGSFEVPYKTCEPPKASPERTARVDAWRKSLGKVNSLGYQVTQPLWRSAIERRKIFNSHDYGKSNGGHDFTRALTDNEKAAIIEYLKTL